MHARFFRRIQIFSKRSRKIALLSFVLFFILLGNVAPAFADDTYKEWTDLFTINSNQILKQPSKAGTWVIDTSDPTKKRVTGFHLQFAFKLGQNGDDKSNFAKTWDHIPGSSIAAESDTFYVRVCEAGDTSLSSCIYGNLKYYLNGEGTNNTTIYRKKDGSYNGGQDILWTAEGKLSGRQAYWSNIDGIGADFILGKQLDVSLWYCGAQQTNNGGSAFGPDPTKAISSNGGVSPDPDRIQSFGSRCDGKPFFRIGNSFQITSPTSIEEANTQNAATPPVEQDKTILTDRSNLEALLDHLAR